MFTYERNELAIPIIGFLLVGFAALFAGINVIDIGWITKPLIGNAMGPCCFALGILLSVVSAYALSKLMMIEGVTFGIFALIMFGATAGFTGVGLLGIALSIVAFMLVFMAYRAGDLLIMIIGLASIVAFIPLLAYDTRAALAVSAIGFFIVGAVALYYTLTDWMLVQDIEFEMEEEMYGDECGCGCGCDDECDCGCEEHSEEESDSDKKECDCEERKEE